MPNPAVFREGADDGTQFETIAYPGWPRYAAADFSADALAADLAREIAARVPRGPVRLVGLSIGGHFAYAAALRLQAQGREIEGFCAIDTFMTASTGWTQRALEAGWLLLRKRRVGEAFRFARARACRALFRLAGRRLPGLFRRFASSGRLPLVLRLDPIFERELSMHLLIRAAASWIASLDHEPRALRSPAILLRTPATACDDAAWRRRCPNIDIVEIPGSHQALFDPENTVWLGEAFIAATRDWRRTHHLNQITDCER